jgi:translocation and assembly module TamB
MSPSKPDHTSANSIYWRLGRFFLKILLGIFVLLLLVIVLVQTPYIQNIARKKAQTYLSNKLKTRVDIGKLYIGFPQTVELDNIYIEDLEKDTLLAGGALKVNLNMWKLFHNEIAVNKVELTNITAKIKRQLPDTTFNFQFIVNAFASDKSKPATAKKDTSALKISLNNLLLNKVRLVYNDIVTGNDMDVWIEHSNTKMDVFDPAKLHFDISLAEFKGIRAKIYQDKPLQEPPSEAQNKKSASASALQLALKQISLEDIVLDYRNTVSALYTNITLGNLKGNVKTFDLNRQLLVMNELELNKTTAAVRIGKRSTSVVINKKMAVVIDSVATGWRLMANNISFNDNNIEFNDDTKPRQRYGIDYAHLKAEKVSLHLNNLLYSKDSIAGNITKAEMHEQSGFVLNNLQTNFLYTNNQAFLKDFIIKTPGTELQRSFSVTFPSIDAVKKDPSKIIVDINLHNSKIQLKDILSFVPNLRTQPVFKNTNATWQINSRMTGSLANLKIAILQFSGLQDTKVDISGTVKNITDTKKINADLLIKNITSSSRDLTNFLPPGKLPANIKIPEQFNISGKINGGLNKINTDIAIRSTSGDVSVKGTAQQFTDKRNALYDLLVTTNKLNLGIILQDKKTWGPVTASFTAKGKGFDPKYANAKLKGIVRSATIKQYPYQNFKIDGSLVNQQFKAVASIQDPNIYFSIDASGNMAAKYPSVQMTMNVDSIKTLPLHLTADNIFYRGKITADFPVTNPDSLMGNLLVTQSLLVKNDLRIPMDTIKIDAGKSDSGRYVRLTSDVVNLQLNGQYRLTQMGNVLEEAMEPYFSTKEDSDLVKFTPYDFTINASVINRPLLKAFLPDLQQLDPVILQSHFTSTNGWQASLKAPLIINGKNKISNVQAQAVTKQNKLNVNASFAQLTNGGSLNIYATNIRAAISENKIDFIVTSKDKNAKNKYRLGGLFQQPKKKEYVFSLNPDSILLNYNAWNINRDNKIIIENNGINISHFELSKEGQLLSLNSTSPAPDAPIDVNFKDFKLSTFTAFAKQDSLAVNGTLNGKATVNNIMKQPSFTSDLTLDNLSMYNDTIGNVHLKVNNTVANTFAANISISGRGNDVQLTGNYYVNPDNNSTFDLTADIRQLQLNTVQGATNQMISDASGSINGKLSITGNLKSPAVNGDLNFNKTRFNLALLNSYFSIDQEKISINKEGIHFDTFTIADSLNNKAVIDGMAYTTDFQHYKFDLTFRANNFHALNTTKKNNKIYYGQLYFSTNLRLKGTEAAPAIDGRITINDKTKLTMVLPQKEPGIEEREGVVQFVTMNAKSNDSLLMAPYDSLNRSGTIKGMDVSVNIEIKKEAELNLIIDEGNGDFLNIRGEALMNAGIDQSGKITLTGSYELEDGSYELTFNFLKRKFDIQKGSKLIWKGEPTQAEVDITAVYIANTAPLDLVENQLEGSTTSIRNTYRQKLPFEVDLKMTGQLLKPNITFDILLPDTKNYNVSKAIIETVNEKLYELRKEPSELNKQVFALLLLNRFVSENPFQSSTGITAESFARASVSKIFTEQLNQLATDLIKGVDLNFDIVSQDDYTSGNRQSKTDLNVGLSKRLLNDRLTVTVGSNFELEGAQNTNQQATNIAGNIALDYKLSKDGRYLLRAYRKNDYQGVLEGYIIETGVGFIITVDYNHFKEIFQSKKEKERKRAEKKAEKEKNKLKQEKSVTSKNE